jgi:hypothetical protein
MPCHNQTLLPVRRAVLPVTLALITALVGPRHAFGEQAINDATEAAFDACSGQLTSVEARLSALNNGNWLIVDDPSTAGDLFALAFAAGQAGSWVPSEDKARQAAVAGESARPLVSRVEPASGQGAKAAKLKGGEPVEIQTFISFLDKFQGGAVLYLGTREATAALKMLVFPTSAARSGYFLSCDLYLAAPISSADVEVLLPNDLKPGDLKKERKFGDYQQNVITYATTSGLSGKLAYIDADGLPQLKEHLARHRSSATLASIVHFESRNVRLTD